MKSILRSIDGHTTAAQVRMERQKHKGAFLLLEGGTDIKRFQRFIDQTHCSTINAYGKNNAITAIELLHEDGHSQCLAMIDADFDRILNTIRDHDGLIWSQTHDVDLDTATTKMFERYIDEVGDKTKIEILGGVRQLLQRVMNSIKPLTALRFANVKHNLGYSLNQLDLDAFFDGSTINVVTMIDHVSRGQRSTPAAKAALQAHVNRYNASAIDLYQATSEHDFCAALGLLLRNVAERRRDAQTWRSEVELHFRLAYDREHFSETDPFRALQAWETANHPYKVLR